MSVHADQQAIYLIIETSVGGVHGAGGAFAGITVPQSRLVLKCIEDARLNGAFALSRSLKGAIHWRASNLGCSYWDKHATCLRKCVTDTF